MIKIEEKYDFKVQIKHIEDYIRKNELNADDMKQINRILFKLRNIDAITCNLDEDLYSSLIDSDYKSLENCCEQIVLGQYNYIPSMQEIVNKILNNLLGYVDFNLLLGNQTGIKHNIRNYKYELTRQNNLIEKDVSELLETIKEKKNNIEDKYSDINKSLSDYNSNLKNLIERFDNLESKTEEFLNQSKTQVNTMIENEKKALEKFHIEISENNKNKFTETENEYVEKFKKLYTEVKNKDKEISELLDIVGEKTRIGEYKKNADISRKERIFWQSLTVILFLFAGAIMCYVTLKTNHYDKFIWLKYIISAILMGAATYTAKQASNLRKDEVYYRKQELELASIDIYLENMTSEQKQEIKKDLSSKIFGQAQNVYTNKNDIKKASFLAEINKALEDYKK